jgi:hypothetical protein
MVLLVLEEPVSQEAAGRFQHIEIALLKIEQGRALCYARMGGQAKRGGGQGQPHAFTL